MSKTEKTVNELRQELEILRQEKTKIENELKSCQLHNKMLEKSALLTEMTINSFEDGIFIKPQQSEKIHYANQTFCRMLGYSEQETKMIKFNNFFAADATNDFLDKLQSVNEVIFQKAMLIQKSGKIFTTEIRIHPIQLNHEIYLFGIFKDVEKFKQTNNLYFFKRIVENSKTAMAITDLDGFYIYVNKAHQELFGHNFSEAEHINYRAYCSAESLKEYETQIIPNITQGKSWEGVLKIVNGVGRHFSLWQHIDAVQDDRRKTLFCFSTMHDLSKQRKLESALKESEIKYQVIFNHAPIGIGITDMAGNVLSANNAMEALTGYTEEELKTTGLGSTYINPTARKELRAALQKDGFVHNWEIRLKRKDGTIYTALINVDKVKLDAREVFLTTKRDISRRKQFEKALTESEERLRTLINATPDFVCFKDGEGRWLEINQTAVELFELNDIDFYGKRDKEIAELSQFYRPAFLTCEVTDEIAWQNKDKLTRTDEIIPQRDGTTKIYDVIKVPLFFQDGSRKGLVVLGRDITERKKIEETLRESEEKFKSISASANDAIIMTDLDDHIIYWNPAAERIFGYTYREILGKELHQAVLPEKVFNAMKKHKNRLKGNKPPFPNKTYELEARKKDGSLIYIEKSLSFVKIKDRLHAMGIIRDVTRRKQAEQEKEQIQTQLQRAQKMEAIGRLAGGIAHDFRNMLSAIQGNIDLALTEVNDAKQLTSDLKMMREAVLRALRLTRQLLLFSRGQEMDFTALNLNTIVNNLHKIISRFIDTNILLEVYLQKDLWTIWADECNVEQVIMNLVINAKDALPEGGKLEVHTQNVTLTMKMCQAFPESRPGKFVRLSVIDTGTGIAADIIDRIFEPFFTTKAPEIGTGLGLSTAYGIIKQHEGWFNVQSKPGEKTCFEVYFPAVTLEITAAEDNQSTTRTLQGNGEQILVVEDEKSVREFIAKALSRYNYRVFEARTVAEANGILAKESWKFKLVFSDIVLPDKNGIEFADSLREREPNLHIILCSGYAETKSKWPEIQKKGYHFLEKPYALSTLLRKISSILDMDNSAGPKATGRK